MIELTPRKTLCIRWFVLVQVVLFGSVTNVAFARDVPSWHPRSSRRARQDAHMAQGGGSDVDNLTAALDSVLPWVQEKLGN